ncbi:MAG: hypothetical protein DRI33_03255 [Caldiserica bacterium]|nr:MAG: hypothetical protein DRI33_03255 [Caldisericota bacterium]
MPIAYLLGIKKIKKGEEKMRKVSLPKDFVSYFLKYSAKQLTKSQVDFTSPLLGQEEEWFQSGELKWQLKIGIIDEDFVMWEKVVTNRGEITDESVIEKLQDMSMYAILKELGREVSLPFFVRKEVFKNISKPDAETVYYKELFCGTDENPVDKEVAEGWEKEQEIIVKNKKEEAEKAKEVKQENKYLSVTWKPTIISKVNKEVQSLEKGRGFASYLIATVKIEWVPEIEFKVDVAKDIKEIILKELTGGEK